MLCLLLFSFRNLGFLRLLLFKCGLVFQPVDGFLYMSHSGFQVFHRAFGYGMAPGTTQKIVLTALGGSIATPNEGVTADVVVVNNFEELQSLGRAQVAGKIVLFNAKFDQRLADNGFEGQAYGQAVIYRAVGASAAARLGAVAALNRSAGGADYRLPHTGALRYADDAPKIPAAAVASEDADLIAHLTNEGKVTMHLVLTPQTLPDVPSFNVVADLKGLRSVLFFLIFQLHRICHSETMNTLSRGARKSFDRAPLGVGGARNASVAWR